MRLQILNNKNIISHFTLTEPMAEYRQNFFNA